MSNKVVFEGYDPFIKQTRTDKGWKVEFETGQDQYPNIIKLPPLEGKMLRITTEIIDKGEK